jgi:hypothetical protein
MRARTFSNVTSPAEAAARASSGGASESRYAWSIGSMGISQKRDAEVVGEAFCVRKGALGRIPARHRDPEDVLASERVGRDGGGERRVDASRQTEDHTAKAALACIVARSENESAVSGLFVRREIRRHRPAGDEIANDDVVCESLGARDHLAGFRKDGAPTVERSSVVAADLIHERDGTWWIRAICEHMARASRWGW